MHDNLNVNFYISLENILSQLDFIGNTSPAMVK